MKKRRKGEGHTEEMTGVTDLRRDNLIGPLPCLLSGGDN